MSHYFRLGGDGKVTGALNGPCSSWHRDFLARAKALGFEAILSLSYELFDAHCPEAWKQRAANGEPALTGWSPPSTLLSPANAEAMAYLRTIALAFAELAAEAGQRVRFQVGEPWWWIMADGRICLYDAAAQAALQPAPIQDMRASLGAGQIATLEAAGALLAASTAALCGAVKAAHPGAETLLLAYLPTVLDPDMPEAVRANLPAGWASPAFDLLQLEDYQWVTDGQRSRSRAAQALAAARLGYPAERRHYLAGFVLAPQDSAQWHRIAAAAGEAAGSGIAETFVWALPQVLRDGFVIFEGETEMDAFEDVRFPVALGREASSEPCFSTDVVTTGGGAEQRNSAWADARLRFDAGPGLRSEEDIHTLLAFFRARRGAAIGFRFEDPFDNSSNGMTGEPGARDQRIGTGDGVRTEFALVKHYGGQRRRIARPVAGTVRVSVAGAEKASGWTIEPGGIVAFETAPEVGQAVEASFRFDVPVRFADDRLALSLSTFRAGEIPSVPLIEIREGGE
jgi:uncharacterized protein (TIGR02217 family)